MFVTSVSWDNGESDWIFKCVGPTLSKFKCGISYCFRICLIEEGCMLLLKNSQIVKKGDDQHCDFRSRTNRTRITSYMKHFWANDKLNELYVTEQMILVVWPWWFWNKFVSRISQQIKRWYHGIEHRNAVVCRSNYVEYYNGWQRIMHRKWWTLHWTFLALLLLIHSDTRKSNPLLRLFSPHSFWHSPKINVSFQSFSNVTLTTVL